ncbi:MAG TPA: Na+/H+ antiporter NhaC [Opitutaceae bacterium]|nr:Na+/H+ antiporter NhaC [Opitutaceae bacterium]
MPESAIAPSPELRRRPGLAHAILALGTTAVILGVGYGLLHISADVLLLGSAVVVGIMGAWFGLGWRELQAGILQSILKGLPAMLVVIIVGAMIGSWIAAGIIPMVVYYGVGLLNPRFFLVTASLAAGVVSLLTGTGYGTIGTIGVAFMGIAHALGVPPGAAAGAIVAGAYLGDKISPFAANANLAVAAAQSDLFEHIVHCLWTTVPALLAGLAVYLVFNPAGAHGPGIAADDTLRLTLAAHFRFSAWLLLPPAITLGAMALRRPVIPSMLASTAAAAVLAVVVQHASLADAAAALGTGYVSHTGIASVDKLLTQGGMLGMMPVTLIAFCAFAYSGLLQKAGLLEPVLARLLAFATRPGRLIVATGLSCLAVELLTGSAFLCILLPGELFAPAYARLGLAPKNLSRTIGDCGIVGVPLIPWSIATAFISKTLGVSVAAYAPWAVFCYAGMAFTVVAGFSGWTVARVPSALRPAPQSS